MPLSGCVWDPLVMVIHFCLGFVVLAVLATAVADPGICLIHLYGCTAAVCAFFFFFLWSWNNSGPLSADIKVVCAKDSMRVTWRVAPQFVPYAARFFLGSCMPSLWKVLPTGEGEAHFNYKFYDCKFTKRVRCLHNVFSRLIGIQCSPLTVLLFFFFCLQLKGKRIIYQNELSFRPQAKPKPVVFKYPVQCVQKR